MQAIILAAGMGKRLKELTKDNTKCMVKVNGVRLIDRLMGQLETLHLTRVVVVIGYCGEALKAHIRSLGLETEVVFVENPIYDQTNNIYSLWLAHEWLCAEDTLLFESDLIFEGRIVEQLIADPRPNLALVDRYESWMDGTCVKIDAEDHILGFVSKSSFRFSEAADYYKTVNIYKFSRDFSANQYVPFLEAYSKAMGNNQYYEQVLKIIAMLDSSRIQAKRLSGERWYEIDDVQDLDIAETLFPAEGVSQMQRISSRYGGYWRYPDLHDFCYLVNPFFPTERMRDEMRASFDTLVMQYPSGLRINRILAAKNFNVHFEQITVGNGAAELISALTAELSGTLGIIRPTFEEYPNRYAGEQIVFSAEAPDFTYTAKDLTDFFTGSGISALVLINPDNPSGNCLSRAELNTLTEWAGRERIRLIVDESFADFAEDSALSLLDRDFLAANPQLIVIKSISKSHGIPGLRLGVLASGDTQLVSDICGRLAIWNINSPAEFYMQIFEKYRADYERGLSLLRAERARFFAALSQIPGIRPVPSQANYIMAEVTGSAGSAALAELLLQDNLLIKDLSTKVGGRPYIRLAVKTPQENDALIDALKAALTQTVRPKNNWKRIWEKRQLDDSSFAACAGDAEALFVELKRCNGFDVQGGKLSKEAMLGQYEMIREKLGAGAPRPMTSVYEVGCGSGANLLLFARDGYRTGGVDYSAALIDIAKKVLDTDDLLCDEAKNLPETPVYDCLLSNSVFAYFQDLEYAEQVLEKMLRKTVYSIGLIDIYDEQKQEAFLAYRRATVEDYEKRYEGLPKLFYSRKFFTDFAEKHGLRVEFLPSTVEGYWNNDFIFNVFLYRDGSQL
ncbi:MAG: aminotransferase class I/II-fold pyridoxal phosphate-dependent enzyme [Oscillospiraceae bacterium]|nr:aminotransferase class I/II-fold pyridoxal phosphate-dependent enzyme [Oscillospiraceae bacterium]